MGILHGSLTRMPLLDECVVITISLSLRLKMTLADGVFVDGAGNETGVLAVRQVHEPGLRNDPDHRGVERDHDGRADDGRQLAVALYHQQHRRHPERTHHQPGTLCSPRTRCANVGRLDASAG